MAISAQTGQERAEQLLALTLHLKKRIQAEYESLKAHRPEQLKETIDDTRQLSNMYRYETLRIQSDPSLLAGVTKETRKALIEATEGFQALLNDHAILVNASKTVTEGLIQAIANEVNRHKQNLKTYGPKSKTAPPDLQSLNLGRLA